MARVRRLRDVIWLCAAAHRNEADRRLTIGVNRDLDNCLIGGQSIPLIKKLRGDPILSDPLVWLPDGRSVIVNGHYDGGTSMTLVNLATSKQDVLRYGGAWVLANWR